MSINFSIADFSKNYSYKNFNNYTSGKMYEIFGKSVIEEPLEIFIDKEQSLEKLIPNINEYLNSLNIGYKEQIIKYYNENMNAKEKANDEWYKKLEIYMVVLTINKDGKLSAALSCADIYNEDYFLVIDMDNKKIVSMYYN